MIPAASNKDELIRCDIFVESKPPVTEGVEEERSERYSL